MRTNGLLQSAQRKGGRMKDEGGSTKSEDVFILHPSSLILSVSGFTLIEVMMSTAILTVVLATTTFFLTSMTDSVSDEVSRGVLEMNGTRALANLADGFADVQISAPAPPSGTDLSSSFVRVREPADLSGDGSLLDDIQAGNFFGVRAPKPWGDAAGWLEYAFVSQDTLDEAGLGDINGDGDTSDEFVRGWLVRKWHVDAEHGVGTDGGLSQNLLWSVIQKETSPGNYGGDIDEDGNADPLFFMADGSKALTISIWIYGRARGKPVIHNVRTSVALRNQP